MQRDLQSTVVAASKVTSSAAEAVHFVIGCGHHYMGLPWGGLDYWRVHDSRSGALGARNGADLAQA